MYPDDIYSFSGDVWEVIEKITDEINEIEYTIDEVKTITSVEVEQLQEEVEALKEYVMSGSTNEMYEMVDDLMLITKNLKTQINVLTKKLTNISTKVNAIYESSFDDIEALSGDVVSIVDQEISNSYNSNTFKNKVKRIVSEALNTFFKTMTQHKSTWQNPINNS